MLTIFSTLLVLNLFSFAGDLPAPLVPDETTTGALCSEQDQNFKELRYEEKIPYCKRNVATSLKAQIYIEYSVPDECHGEYTIDHFYPLAIGGNNERQNLWPEHKALKKIRQDLEIRLYKEMKDGKTSQAQATKEIEDFKLHPQVNEIEKSSYCELVPKAAFDSFSQAQ